MNKDHAILLTGFLGALKLLLSSLGVDIITDDIINAVVDLIAFGTALFAVWKNTYISSKAQEQRTVLQDKGLLK